LITAVDTSVLIDVLTADERFGERSRQTLRQCLAQGAVVACDIVWTETSAAFQTDRAARDALGKVGIAYDPLEQRAAEQAGRDWSEYRGRGGPRGRVIADFLVGAHALLQADRLLTRDRGFYRRYFARLAVLDPAA
jgi:hypothetical protein